MSNDDELLPIFPPKIERAIVEMAAEEIRFPLKNHHYCCLELQLMAHRFREWYVVTSSTVVYLEVSLV